MNLAVNTFNGFIIYKVYWIINRLVKGFVKPVLVQVWYTVCWRLPSALLEDLLVQIRPVSFASLARPNIPTAVGTIWPGARLSSTLANGLVVIGISGD